jgi:hypothetical protein
MSLLKIYDRHLPGSVETVPFIFRQHELIIPFPDGGSALRICKVVGGLAISTQGQDAEAMSLDISITGEITIRPRRKPWLEPLATPIWVNESQ